MSSLKSKECILKTFVFDHPQEDIPLFIELFAPSFKEMPSLESIYEMVDSYTFFDRKDPVYVILEQIPKALNWSLLQKSDVSIYLFFTKSVQPTQGIESHVFAQEKPWDRQKRIHQWIDQYCQKQKKSLSKEAFDRLFRICEGFGLAILRHVEPILLSMKGSYITIDHLAEHHLYDIGPNDWEKAKEMIFSPNHRYFPDLLDILSYLPKLRQEIYYNLAMFEEHPKLSIPPYRKKDLQQKQQIRNTLGKEYFFGLLPILLEVELLAKSASFTQQMLFDMMFVKMLKLYNSRTGL